MTDQNFETGCIEGYKIHDYSGGVDVCKRCGLVKKGAKLPRNLSGTVTSSSRKSSSKTERAEPSFTRTEAKDGITMLLLASQTIILSARPDLKEDALNPKERMMLADALADEAFESTTVRRFLTKLGKQKKHTKLAMVCMALAIPRLARHGLIPQDGMQELNDELVAQASSSPGFNGNPTGESEPGWDTIPVESGGSPFINRRNGIRENNVSGVVVETAPIRGGVENENGRSTISDAGSGEIPSSDEEFTTESYRAKTRQTTRRSEKS